MKISLKRLSLVAGALLLCLGVILAGCSTPSTGQQPNTNKPPQMITKPVLSSIHMIDGQSGWAAGNGMILHTNSGGDKWVNVTPPHLTLSGSVTMKAQFLDNVTAWLAVGQNSYPNNGKTPVMTIFHTADAGANWDAANISSPAGYIPMSICFINRSTGWLLAGSGASGALDPTVLLQTTDGGRHWVVASQGFGGPRPQVLPLGDGNDWVYFAGPSRGWVVGVQCVARTDEQDYSTTKLFVTKDGGRNWSPAAMKMPPSLGAVEEAYLGMPVFSGLDGIMPLTVVYYVPNKAQTHMVIYFYVSHSGGSAWENNGSMELPSSLGVNSYRDNKPIIDFINPQYGWVLANGKLYRTSDGGKRFSLIYNLSKATVLDFINKSTGWAVTSRGLLKTHDGGKTWMN